MRKPFDGLQACSHVSPHGVALKSPSSGGVLIREAASETLPKKAHLKHLNEKP